MVLPVDDIWDDRPVTIVGAGISGAACAVALQESGIAVRVVDRGRAPGGRMASPVLEGRRVDIGAGYFTVRDPAFAAVVERWAAAGQAREWTNSFAVLAPGHDPERTLGPMRWSTPDGLRSLVRALLDGIKVEAGTALDTLPDGPVVLAMPDPQAARLVDVPDAVAYDPTIAVVCGFADRHWSFVDAAFVHDHPDVEFVADDGARRGDGAPVLVAHTTAARARRHLDDPAGAVEPVVAALAELAGTGSPIWTRAHRWTFAKPAGQHQASYGVIIADDRGVGLVGDQWCPQGSPRIESAWRSGTDLGEAIVVARAGSRHS
jgi:renalase